MTTSHNSPLSLGLPDGLVRCSDGLIRPTWASHDELIRDYYDHEWGFPVHDEVGVFERLVLEGFQAGLSWRTVLDKREAFREAFEGFVPDRVAAFTTADIDRLVGTPGIIRNRRKIEAAITNARATVALRSEADPTAPSHLGELVWSYRPAQDPRPRWLWPPTSSAGAFDSWDPQRCSRSWPRLASSTRTSLERIGARRNITTG